ncbi:MAG TPA: superinfection immunity protein [Chthoniobacter sp.]|nr:superinfection immunity protein [Chthoniobacter sp.]
MLVLLLCFVARVALALDIITTDGQFYKGVTVSQVEPDALRIMHSDGAARISYDKLPTAIQKQYFDPEKVAAYREQIAAAKRVAEEAAAAKAEEERRQRAIAAAQAQEQREQEEEASRHEKAVKQQKEEEDKATAAAAESLRQTIAQNKKHLVLGLLVIGGILSVFLYFLPSIVGRHKANAMAIFAMNLFLGWTFIGWVAALIWACTQDSAMEQLARARMNMPPQPAPPPRPYGTISGAPTEEGGRYLEGGRRYLE